jgi:Protein kinase domain/Domain of unknown function (DUF4384)
MNMVQPPDDDGATVIPSPTFSKLNVSSAHPNALAVGTTLGEFEITGIVGQGGFGIVYLAYDHSLQRKVALKEYLPSALAGRGAEGRVTVHSEQHLETFQAGLRSFVNEARLLAQFDHPSLVKVYRFWESNGTAYMVMPLYQGVTLKETLRQTTSKPGEDWLKRLLTELLDALEVIHKDNCLHRDISPDNILILPEGRPVLLDFGAARRVIGGMTHALTVILKPGYAPIEQYGDVVSMPQGPWTDIYALGAVIYFAITGNPPLPSVGRIVSDPLIPLSISCAGTYSLNFLSAIDKALAVKPEGRPQSISEFRALLSLEQQHRPYASEENRVAAPEIGVEGKTGRGTKRSAALYGALGFLIVALAGAGAFIAFKKPATTTAVATQSAEVLAQKETVPSTVERQFDPLKALDEIFELRDRNHAVTASTVKAVARIGEDPLRFKIRSAKKGYVYLLMVGTNRQDFFLLFPNAVDKKNYVRAGEQLDLPRPEWKMIADGPPGTDHFLVIVSNYPRDFSSAGLQNFDSFARFAPEDASRLYREYRGSTPLFAGKAMCEAGTPGCSELYGAAVFSVEEVAG